MPSPFRLPSLRRSLKLRVTLSTLAICLACSWSLSYYLYRVFREDIQQRAIEQQALAAAHESQEIGDAIGDRLKALQRTAQSLAGLPPAALQAKLENRTELGLLFNGGAFVTDTAARVVASIPAGVPRVGESYAAHRYIRRALEEDRPAIDAPTMDSAGPALTIGMAVPLHDAGGVMRGVLAGTIRLGQTGFLAGLIRKPHGEAGSYLLVSRTDRRVVAASDETLARMPPAPPGSSELMDRMFDGFDGSGVTVGAQGVEVLVSARAVPSTDWRVIVGMPTAQAFGLARSLQARLLVGTALLSALAAVLVWLLLRRQLAPLTTASRELVRRTQAHENLQALPVHAEDEIGTLIVGFNGLLRTLGQREADLRIAATAFESQEGIFVTDAHWVILKVNSAFTRLTGYTPEDAIGRLPQALLGSNRQDPAFYEAMGHTLETQGSWQGEVWDRRRDGAVIPIWLMLSTLRDTAGRVTHYVAAMLDISHRKQAEARLQLAASVFDHAREGIMVTDTQGTIVEVNAAFSRITGYGRDEAIGRNPRLLSSGRQDPAFYKALWDTLATQGHWAGEVWNRRKGGEIYAELLTISALRDSSGETQQYVALFSDITPIKEHQRQLEHMANYDPLTHLPNRFLLTDRMQQAMGQALRRGQQVAVVFLDLDGFKSVNDRHGHGVGDQLLIHLAHAMRACLREGDTLARIGGDEFVAVLIDLPDTDSCLPLLQRLLDSACSSLTLEMGTLEMGTLQCSASIGVTFYPQAQELEADQLLRQADQAMYQAKLSGKNRFHIFDAAHDSSLRVQHEALQRMAQAIERGEFVLHYQPKVNMRSGALVGAEALIRWQHPERGLLPPSEFLPALEAQPLAVELGEWVIHTALQQLASWQAQGLHLDVSVNIGAEQLQRADFVPRLKALLARHPQVNPACLELEVLETSALADMETVSRMIEECATIGVRFALDDFGTGYSSLTYLKRLGVATIKIDQSFVRDMLDDPDDLAILQGVIGLANAFRREVVAEGVETVAHGAALLQLGCELAQGYGIARPMAPELLAQWAAQWQPDASWSALPWLGGAHETDFG